MGNIITVAAVEGASALPSAFSAIVSEIWTQGGTLLTTIEGHAILVIPVAFAFGFGIVRMVKRLMRFH